MKTVILALVLFCVAENINMQFSVFFDGSNVDGHLFRNGTCSTLCVILVDNSFGIRNCGKVHRNDQRDGRWSVCPPSFLKMSPTSQTSKENTENTGLEPTPKRRPLKGILIVPYSYNRRMSFLYNPLNQSISPFPRLVTASATTAVYIRSRETIVFLTHSILKYYTLSSGKSRKRRVRNVPKIYALAVDNINEKIFFGTEKDNVCVGHMLLSLLKPTIVYCWKAFRIQDLCLDEQRESMFAGTTKAIFKVPYAGKTHVPVFYTRFLRCLTFYNRTNQLFYVDKKTLFIASLATSAKERVQFRNDAYSMTVNHGILMVTYNTKRFLRFIDLATKRGFNKKIESQNKRPCSFTLCPLQ